MRGGFQFGGQASDLDEFFRLFGDTDGDRDVDGQDFGELAIGIRQGASDSRVREPFDVDGDGDLDSVDRSRFRRNLFNRLRP